MRISTAEEYGMRLTMALAVAGEQLSVLQLSERERLPEATVAKVLGSLRQGGVVVAQRGRNGGYELASAPAEITVGMVVRAFEEPLFQGRFCQRPAADDPTCVHRSDCGLRPVWRRLETLIDGFLDRVTVADLIASERESRELVREHTIPATLLPIRVGGAGTNEQPE